MHVLKDFQIMIETAFVTHVVLSMAKSIVKAIEGGNIRHFEIGFRKHHNRESCISIPKKSIEFLQNKDLRNQHFKIFPTCFDKKNININIGKRKLKYDLKIEHDCKLIRRSNEYWICCPIDIEIKQKSSLLNYCGIDPGVRTFMTVFGKENVIEYKHNKILLDKINKQIYYIKQKRIKQCHNKFLGLRKREARKSNIVNELHWKTINSLLASNDVIMYGDIKSHNIVKNNKNTTLNQNFNDLKFFQFKNRLLYKANIENKLVFPINEAYTSQCCSHCGTLNKPGKSKIYNCSECNVTYDRDINAAKNILIKGIETRL